MSHPSAEFLGNLSLESLHNPADEQMNKWTGAKKLMVSLINEYKLNSLHIVQRSNGDSKNNTAITRRVVCCFIILRPNI